MINYILLALILVGIIVFVVKNRLEVKSVLKYMGINVFMGAGFAGIGYSLARIMALIMSKPFKLTYLPLVPYEEVIIILTLVISFILYYGVMFYISKKYKEKDAYLAGSMSTLWVLSVAFTFALPGGSYLTVFPVLVTLVCLFVSRISEKFLVNRFMYVMLIPFALILILFAPTIYLFNCALTFGGFVVTMIFVWIAYIALTNCIVEVQH